VVTLALLILTPFALSSARGPSDLSWQLASVATTESFNLWTWEVRTLAQRESSALFAPVAPQGPDVVVRYFQLTGEADRAKSELDAQWARQAVNGNAPELAAAQQKYDALEAQVGQLRPTVEATISSQIEAELSRQGIQAASLVTQPSPAFPFLRPSLTPGVFFQLGPLPDLLVVAPRDRIELIGSVLIRTGLSTGQVDDLERSADGLGVSSVVTGIGGLAAYPSMLPDSSSGRDLLVTIAHEWTHHYLALRPLGMGYWDGYAMTTINETVADMVGREIGGAVYDDSYAPLLPPPPRPAPSSTPAPPARPDFGTLMRGIRSTVEGYLSRHDVAGADAYMAEQQQVLARDGYYVRRLNTAYLSFWGSYSGSANPYELKLRLLRSRTSSIAAFLRDVSEISQPSDLDRILADPPYE
jgi:hypothetical protein